MNIVVRRKGKISKWMVILIFLGVIAVLVWGGILLSAPGRREVQKLTIDVIDFEKLRDGTYVGEYIGTKIIPEIPRFRQQYLWDGFQILRYSKAL